ncbi:MFS transporter [Alteraurantiacibacter buctensis]|uniref:MFS transporter n=1 Tax=Alteraurantiacibacter buctensis TaxID=1503981 RepID=A0A844YSR5_9SPHN|nr:MFS transporter [Alteraurantiacibacter buctensis]MXO70056.1 MFS transporter [Alteraurantiacibacter buctensis]
MTRSAGARHGIVLLLASVLPVMAINSLVPVLPMLLQEFGDVPGSSLLVPMALTIPALCVALFSPLAGWLSDRIGRKRLLVAALLLYALAGVVPLLLADLVEIMVARVFLGIAEAAIMTVATALIADYFLGEQRDKWFALQVGFVSIAAIVLVALGGLLGEGFGSRGPFLMYFVAIPIAVAAALILFEPGELSHQADTDTGGFPVGKVLPLIAVTFGVGLLFYTIIVQLGQILQLAGPASPARIGMAGAGANLGMVLGSYLFRRANATAGAALLATGLALCAIGYAGLWLAPGFWSLAVAAFVACAGCGLLLPNMLTWTVSLLPGRQSSQSPVLSRRIPSVD